MHLELRLLEFRFGEVSAGEVLILFVPSATHTVGLTAAGVHVLILQKGKSALASGGQGSPPGPGGQEECEVAARCARRKVLLIVVSLRLLRGSQLGDRAAAQALSRRSARVCVIAEGRAANAAALPVSFCVRRTWMTSWTRGLSFNCIRDGVSA